MHKYTSAIPFECNSTTVVCGIDNKEYANECAARDAGVAVVYKGEVAGEAG